MSIRSYNTGINKIYEILFRGLLKLINFNHFFPMKEEFIMYTVDTSSLLTFLGARYKTSPNWYDSEKYYNCEDFYSILHNPTKKEKKMSKNRR